MLALGACAKKEEAPAAPAADAAPAAPAAETAPAPDAAPTETPPEDANSEDAEQSGGDKVKQTVTVRTGVDQELGKKIVKLIKDARLKVQASIQGDAVRVSGAKKDVLQDAIALVRKSVTDYPLQYQNFRD